MPPKAVDRTPPRWPATGLPCHTSPELFFADKDTEPNRHRLARMSVEAKELCTGCPIKRPCREYALEVNERFGVWGGTSYTDRVKIRSQRGTRTHPVPNRAKRTDTGSAAA